MGKALSGKLSCMGTGVVLFFKLAALDFVFLYNRTLQDVHPSPVVNVSCHWEKLI